MGELLILIACVASFTLFAILIVAIAGILHVQASEEAKKAHSNKTGHTEYELRDLAATLKGTITLWMSPDGVVPASLPTWFCKVCGKQIYPSYESEDEIKEE